MFFCTIDWAPNSKDFYHFFWKPPGRITEIVSFLLIAQWHRIFVTHSYLFEKKKKKEFSPGCARFPLYAKKLNTCGESEGKSEKIEVNIHFSWAKIIPTHVARAYIYATSGHAIGYLSFSLIRVHGVVLSSNLARWRVCSKLKDHVLLSHLCIATITGVWKNRMKICTYKNSAECRKYTWRKLRRLKNEKKRLTYILQFCYIFFLSVLTLRYVLCELVKSLPLLPYNLSFIRWCFLTSVWAFGRALHSHVLKWNEIKNWNYGHIFFPNKMHSIVSLRFFCECVKKSVHFDDILI